MHMRLLLLVGALHAVSTVAVDTTVELGYATYIGQEDHDHGLTQWLGIQYAAPPLDDLRFAPPQDPPKKSSPQQADQAMPPCLEVGGSPDDPEQSEDCLYLNVMAPSDADEDSKLPVYFFIQGGGFSKNASPNINPTGIIEAADKDLVVVAIQYRVGPYGFLTDGDHLKANNGLRDQRKALEWVQDHIEKFGGDPDHVVIGGVSAGGASVTFHLTAENGKDHGLFHGAMVQSGSFAPILTIEQSQYQYDNLTERLGCTDDDTLACLRSKTSRELQEQNFNIPLPGGVDPPLYQWLPTLDFDFVTDYTYKALAEGNFIQVPTLVGDDTNGGTVFAPNTLSTREESNAWIRDQYPWISGEDKLEDLEDMYPNPNLTCPNEGCWWRRTANVYQEIRFMCPGLYINDVEAGKGAPSWAYLYNVEDPDDMRRGYGVKHTIELSAIIGAEYTSTPPSYVKGGLNGYVTPVIRGYWTSFMRSLDPNKHRLKGTAKWATWNDEPQARLVLGTMGTTKMWPISEGLRERCEYWIENGVDMLL